VRRFLLEWIPHYVVAPRDILEAAQEGLLTFLRYLDASGLRDPRGTAVADDPVRRCPNWRARAVTAASGPEE